ncbi:threonine synthase, partial [bacterium]|nr:threonine synthase [bacterium]
MRASIRYYSTNLQTEPVSLQEAVLSGLAPDGGLYLPEQIPPLPTEFFTKLPGLTFPEISLAIARHLLLPDVPETILAEIFRTAMNFPVPLRHLQENNYVLELFHGPTLAFKDFAARFMAGLMGYFVRHADRELTILVATSGDTGGAVANGFLQTP